MSTPVSSPSPKYQKLVERFRRQITSGVLSPGDRMPSLKEMRDNENLSRPTVEKAYATLEREGLVERQPGAGVFVRETASKKLQGIIGLCGENFNFAGYSPYWAHLLGGAREAAMQAGVQLLMLDVASLQSWEKADGVLVCDWNDPRMARRSLPGMPIVSLMTPIAGIASAVADDEGGAHDATAALLQMGHRRIAFLHGYEDHDITHNRLAGYRKALREAGISPRREWARCMRGSYTFGKRFTTEARKNMLLWLREDWKKLGCTALLCHNDEAATGVIAALQEAGIRVPEDVSIIGFDGTEYSEMVSPALSTVEIPLRAIGAAGVELLLHQIKRDEISSDHKVLATRLRIRASSRALTDPT